MPDRNSNSLQAEGAEGPGTTGHGPSRDPTETSTIAPNNLNTMFDRIQEYKTKRENQSFVQEQPDFKKMQARRGSFMQNLWETITRSPDEK
ncbi:hypothetical protein PHISCL_06862 [Aspergillus sclerotialis]|uniref:Uncharacterized protein n=1 Tax=Aspergillus sclerotialis TaxID=2070753 RepID=A0A3A2ZEM4_9EURO|nr:hypothetical protein PHISCL_06862 [Aspergillus sclerotialis]